MDLGEGGPAEGELHGVLVHPQEVREQVVVRRVVPGHPGLRALPEDLNKISRSTHFLIAFSPNVGGLVLGCI